MDKQSRQCCTETVRRRYQKASKAEKSRILDEFCATCDYNRKYAIRILSAKPSEPQPRKPPGRKPIYHKPSLAAFIRKVHITSNLICSKRLKGALPLFAPYADPPLSDEDAALVSSISPATIDRLLQPFRHCNTKLGLATTKPGSLLRKQIPIKTNQWDQTVPGFVEADTVAHCGSSTAGSFVYTLNLVDIATGWSIQRALWGKGQTSCFEALRDIEATLPFRLRGFDCDNGSEFINYHLQRHFCNRKQPVQYTRSRPYNKNDNAHIEQKNWSIVRQYLGYQRFDLPDLLPLINDLYANELYLLNNFFLPSFKLIDKQRIGARIHKRHDPPKTPLQRLLLSGSLPKSTERSLRKTFNNLNPFDLQKAISIKVAHILNFVAGRGSP